MIFMVVIFLGILFFFLLIFALMKLRLWYLDKVMDKFKEKFIDKDDV